MCRMRGSEFTLFSPEKAERRPKAGVAELAADQANVTCLVLDSGSDVVRFSGARCGIKINAGDGVARASFCPSALFWFIMIVSSTVRLILTCNFSHSLHLNEFSAHHAIETLQILSSVSSDNSQFRDGNCLLTEDPASGRIWSSKRAREVSRCNRVVVQTGRNGGAFLVKVWRFIPSEPVLLNSDSSS